MPRIMNIKKFQWDGHDNFFVEMELVEAWLNPKQQQKIMCI